MALPDLGEKGKPQTPEQILRGTALQFKELRAEAREALYERNDTEAYKNKLQERAELILNLPAKIRESVKSGENFPDSGFDDLQVFAWEAGEALESGGVYGLGVLLIHQGTKIGDPNELEGLINRLYPTQRNSSR